MVMERPLVECVQRVGLYQCVVERPVLGEGNLNGGDPLLRGPWLWGSMVAGIVRGCETRDRRDPRWRGPVAVEVVQGGGYPR